MKCILEWLDLTVSASGHVILLLCFPNICVRLWADISPTAPNGFKRPITVGKVDWVVNGVCIFICELTCVCRGQRKRQMSYSATVCLILWRWSPCLNLELTIFDQGVWSASPSTGTTGSHVWPHPAFYGGPQAFTASTLPHWAQFPACHFWKTSQLEY